MRAQAGPYSAGDVVRACGGSLVSGDTHTAFDAITTDSRDVRAGDLFVALHGEHFDGHDFLLPALEAGARGALTDREINREIHTVHPQYVLIQVQDTLQALTDLASAHRSIHPTPLIAVTGSSGKTTVKEMIAAVLGRSHHPLVSQGNLNNLVGLPMTVLGLGPHHTVAVVEAGINRPGEMEHLARAAAPDVAVITTLGPVHLEGLGTVENVAREKFRLVQALTEAGTAVLPADNHYLRPLLAEYSGRLITFGLHQGTFRAENLVMGTETSFDMVTPSGSRHFTLRVPGSHNVANALAAAAACWALGVDLKDAADALGEFRPPTWRMELLPLPGDRVMLRDCYNANPQSMKAAMEVLSSHGRHGSRLALLGDMMELGQESEKLHGQVGGEAARLGIDRAIFVGRFGRFFQEGFVAGGGNPEAVSVAADKEAAWLILAPELSRYGTILVKGSRAMKMELLADRILGEN